nr:MAG TPA: hypothetical protein [Caudoviricetes sp.]
MLLLFTQGLTTTKVMGLKLKYRDFPSKSFSPMVATSLQLVALCLVFIAILLLIL